MIQKTRSKIAQKYGDKKSYLFLKEFFRRFGEDNVAATGAQLAYYLIMSFFPFLIFLLSLLTFTSLGQEDVLTTLLSVLPAQASNMVYPVIMDIVSLRSGTVLSLSLVLALWAGSSGTANLIKAIHRAFDIEEGRNLIIGRMISVFYTILLAALIIITLLGQVFGDFLLSKIFEWLGYNQWVESIWNSVKLILPLGSMLIGFALFYKFAPKFRKGEKITVRQAFLGSIVAALGWVGLSKLFKIYVANFSNYANTYGSIGAIIVLLLWLFISAVLIMVGAEVIATYRSVYKKGRCRYAGASTQALHGVSTNKSTMAGSSLEQGHWADRKTIRIKPRYIMRRDEKKQP